MSSNQPTPEKLGNPPKTSEKNIGIEMLRILAILFVVTLHVMGQGGVFVTAGVDAFSANNAAAVSFELLSFGAVNLFALVSGFVALRSKWATKKWLRMWVMVAFWGVVMVFIVDKASVLFDGFNAVLKCFIPGIRPDFEAYTVSGKDYLDALLPISAKQYWYFNMYTMLFLLMPLLNLAIGAIHKKKLAFICTAALVGISVYSLLPIFRGQSDTDLFGVGGGYSSMWLVVMYLVGACVRRYYDDGFRPKKSLCLLGYLLCIMLAAGWYFFMSSVIRDDPQNTVLYLRRSAVTSYISPFTVIGSLLLLFFFMQIKVSSKPLKKCILVVSGSSFAVYIIHAQQVVWRYFLTNRFSGVVAEPVWKMILQTIGGVLAIYAVCTLMELLRKMLFEVTHLDKGIDRVGDAIDRKLKKTVYEKKQKG